MIVISLLAAAVLVHELLYVTRDGREYLDRCFVPTFGLQLSSRVHRHVHIALMAVCIAMAAMPSIRLLHVLAFVLLTVVIASYSLRLSNHLVLAWFLFVVLLLAGTFPRDRAANVLRTGTAMLIISTYFISFFHKLNRDFLSERRSQAAELARFLCRDRGIRRPAIVRALSIYSIWSTLTLEAAIPLLLLWPPTRAAAVLIAILFHYSLALLGIVNFSAMMVAGLAAFLPVWEWSLRQTLQAGTAAAIATCAATCLLTWLVTPRRAGPLRPYRFRNAAWAIQFAFALLIAWLLLESVQAIGGPPVELVRAAPVLFVIAALYTLNGFAPYLGVKTEFSMAMFSNLHGKRWNHLLVPAQWRMFNAAGYLVVERIEGLPDAGEIAHDEAALLAHAVLSRPDAYEYRPYFFFEGLKRIRASSAPRALDVAFRFEERRYTIRGDSIQPRPDFPPWKRVNSFPFVLPFDGDAPHSEQGSITTRESERMLF